MVVVLDTNFILEMVKEKVDFLDIENYGKILIPRLVLAELDKVRREAGLKDRGLAELALKIIEKIKDRVSFIELDKKFVDAGIIDYSSKNKEVIVATIDRDLKKELAGKARILTLVNRKKLVLL